MPTYSIPKGTIKNDVRFLSLLLAPALSLFANYSSAQIYLPKPPPEPSAYGRVVLDNSSTPHPGAVVFDHWLHRSRFTCRVCHVDIGFAMQAKATGITADSNRQGFHCGACHDGTKSFDGKPVFASCSDSSSDQCDRCHSLGKTGVRKLQYTDFTAKFPKAIYGINWELAESSGIIKPIDFIPGISVKTPQLQRRADFAVDTGSWVTPVGFSHQKHSIWNGCELCHPEIFPTANKESVHYSMFYNVAGRYCGACHGKVAFPLNNCQKCHPRAPLWVHHQADAAAPAG